MEDEAINFEQSNQITKNQRSSQPDWGRLGTQLKQANWVTRGKEKFSNLSGNIIQSTQIDQLEPP